MGRSTPVQSRNEQDIVVGLQDVRGFSLQFPIRVVYEHKDSWAAVMQVNAVSKCRNNAMKVWCLHWESSADEKNGDGC